MNHKSIITITFYHPFNVSGNPSRCKGRAYLEDSRRRYQKTAKNYLKYVKTPNKTNIMHFLKF